MSDWICEGCGTDRNAPTTLHHGDKVHVACISQLVDLTRRHRAHQQAEGQALRAAVETAVDQLRRAVELMRANHDTLRGYAEAIDRAALMIHAVDEDLRQHVRMTQGAPY